MHSLYDARPDHMGRGAVRPPFSPIALAARDRVAAALVAIAGLWLVVAWALDWLK